MLQTEDEEELLMLLALFNSIPFDYFVRLKMPGIDLTQSVVRQVPVPSKSDYNQAIMFNEKNETLKVHVLSCVLYLLRTEIRLKELVDKFQPKTYRLKDEVTHEEARKMLDRLFALAYGIDKDTFIRICQSFSGYMDEDTNRTPAV